MTSSKRVLFLSYDGLTDPLGQSQILPYFKGLSKEGYSITILSCEKEIPFSRNAELIKKICLENGIRWEFVFYTKSPPVLSTFLDLRRMENKVFKLHKEDKFDIVHCRTILPTSIGLKLQQKGVKFIFDIRGFWSDERVDGKLWNLNNPLYFLIYKLFKFKEKKAYRKSDHIITLTNNAKKELNNTFSVNINKIDVVPCTVDLEHFSLNEELIEKGEKIRAKLEIPDNALVVCYAGSLGTRYMIEEMLNCFSTILENNVEALFLIVSHSDTGEVVRIAERLGIKDHIKITATNYSEIPSYLVLADVALYFIYEGNSGKAVSPTKQAEFLSLGIPIITNNGIGDSSEILEQNNVGIVIDDFTNENYTLISEQVSSISQKPTIEIINIAKKYFSLEKGINTYKKVYKELC